MTTTELSAPTAAANPAAAAAAAPSAPVTAASPNVPGATAAPVGLIFTGAPFARCAACGNPRGGSDPTGDGASGPPPGEGSHLGVADPRVHYYQDKYCAQRNDSSGHGRRLVSPVVAERAALAADPQCPKEFMLLLSNDETVVREALAVNPALTLRIMKRLARFGGSPALMLARRRTVPSEILAIIAETSYRQARYARNQGLYPWRPTRSVYDDALEAVLSRPDCPPELLAQYSRRDASSQALVAGNPQSTEEILEYLAAHGRVSVLETVATNPNCPPEGLAHVVARGSWPAMGTVAAHPRVTPEILSSIVERAPSSRFALWVLLRLIAADWPRARSFVRSASASHRQVLVRQSTAARSHMAVDPDWRLRYAVAVAGPQAGQLRELAADPHGRVRRAASQRLLGLLAG